MRRPRFRAGVAALATAGCALFAAPAATAAPSDLPPWQPYRSSPFTDAPGDPCPFGVSAVPVRDEEQFRTLASYPNGDPKVQEFRGPLYYRYTNQSTGKSVVRDLSGYAFFRYGQDGTFDGLFLNNGGITVHQGNHGYPAGEWVFHGQFLVTDDGSGSRHIDTFHASAENLCHTLA
jgi:hypothetical protein